MPKSKNNYFIHIGLFLITFVTTTIAGMQWTTGIAGPFALESMVVGLPYSISIMFMITCHEFGHYFAAKYHNVEATLPYYIPFPFMGGLFLNFGTMGAVIRTKTPVMNKKAMFDIGIAGPIAGFIATIGILIIGFLTLPGKEYILAIHPDYFSPEYGKTGLQFGFGNNLIFLFLKWLFADNYAFFPPMSEIYHYPFLCVGWFGLFITAMNMIPVGQLDGGHISYALFGDKKQYTIAVICFMALFAFGLIGISEYVLEMPIKLGWEGWLVWALLLFFIIKLKHPPIHDTEELDTKRRILGYISFAILILSFTPIPFTGV
ncbi:MAG: site-2 protease family protein [Syntrophothermus sp.]